MIELCFYQTFGNVFHSALCSDYTCSRMTFSFSLIPFFSALPGSVKRRLWLKKKKRFRFGILRERNVLSCKYYDLKNLRFKKPHMKIHNTNLMPSIKNCCSVAKLCRLFVTPWTAAWQGSLSCRSLSPSVCSNSCPLSQ